MEDNKQDSITIFDTLFTNNHICMLKILLPLLPSPLQRNIAVYIKYLELQYTLQYFRNQPSHYKILDSSSSDDKADYSAIFDNMLPYCNMQEKQTVTQMRNMFHTFQNMKEMMEMIETMKEFFPEGFDISDGINPDMMAGLNGMFGNGSMDIFKTT